MPLSRTEPLLAAGEALQVDAALIQLARVRSDFERFTGTGARAALAVRRAPLGPEHPELLGLERSFGRFRIRGAELEVDIPDDGYAAIAAVRLAYHLAVARRGGVLLHASAVLTGAGVVLTAGPSGAGKSTLARLLVERGGALLSDEIVALFPDGRVFGTPFRSDYEEPGRPGPGPLRLVVLPRRGDTEELRTAAAVEVVQTLASQLFRPEGGELSLADAFERLGAATRAARSGAFYFRPRAEAAEYLLRWLDAQEG